MSHTVSTMSQKRFLLVLTVLLISGFSSLMNETLFVIALPKIAQTFGVSEAATAWTSTAFFLTMGITIPLTAFIQQHYDLKKIFIVISLFYIAGCLVGFFSTNFTIFILARVLQALGAAFIVPLANTVVLLEAPRDRIGFYNGLMWFVLLSAPALAPIASGMLLSVTVWRMAFILLIIPSAVALLASFWAIPYYIRPVKSRLDFPSVALDIIGFGGIVLGIGSISDYGFLSTSTLVPLVIGAFGLSIFIHRQLRIPNPLLELRILTNKEYHFSFFFPPIILFFLFSFDVIMPLYLQNVFGFSALTTGLYILPCGIANAGMCLIAGRAYDWWGIKIIPVGLAISVLGFLVCLSGGSGPLVLGAFILGSCLFFASTPVINTGASTFGLTNLTSEEVPHGIAFNQTMNQCFGAIGTAFNIMLFYSGPKLPWINDLTGINRYINGYESVMIFTLIVICGLAIHYFAHKPDKEVSHG